MRDNGREAPLPRVGLLGLTLELYEDLAPGLREGREEWVRQEIIPALDPVADVDFSGACFRRPDVEDEVRRFEEEQVDAILTMLLTYSPSQIALPALKRTDLPILIWNTQELYAVDQDFSPERMTANHGVHGTQDLANVLTRSGVDFHYVTSHPSDPDATGELEDFFRAAASVSRLRQTDVGLLGYPFPGMGDFAVDTTHLAATLGCSWTQLSMNDYVDRTKQAPVGPVSELVEEYHGTYELSEEIVRSDLEATARTEIALRQLVREHSLGAITYQFQSFGEQPDAETVPFLAASRLMAEGVGFGGEGDIVGAAGTTFLNALQPPATFSEIFTTDFDGNSLLMSHMGEANPRMHRTDIPLRLARRSPITETSAGQLVPAVSPEPGPATLMSLAAGPAGRWRIISSRVTIVDFGPLPDLQVPHFKIRPEGDVRDFLTNYAVAGGPHHNALCFGDARGPLQMAASMMDAEYVEV